MIVREISSPTMIVNNFVLYDKISAEFVSFADVDLKADMIHDMTSFRL